MALRQPARDRIILIPLRIVTHVIAPTAGRQLVTGIQATATIQATTIPGSRAYPVTGITARRLRTPHRSTRRNVLPVTQEITGQATIEARWRIMRIADVLDATV